MHLVRYMYSQITWPSMYACAWRYVNAFQNSDITTSAFLAHTQNILPTHSLCGVRWKYTHTISQTYMCIEYIRAGEMYTYEFVYRWKYIAVHTDKYIHTYILCLCLSIYIYIYKYNIDVRVFMFMKTYIYMHTNTNVLTCTYTNVFSCVCMPDSHKKGF